jgi:protein gp37
VPQKVAEPLTWSRQRMAFVNTMSDLFHKDVPDQYIELVVRVMATADCAEEVFNQLTTGRAAACAPIDSRTRRREIT